jgi:hypothetical protein
MEFDTLIFLLAAGYALLQWMIRGARKAAGQNSQQPDVSVEQAEVAVRRQRRLEQLKARRQQRIDARQAERATRVSAPGHPVPQSRQEQQLEEFRRTMEQLLGVRTGPQSGPLGRRGGVILESDEDVEEVDTLEEEPEVVSLETGSERAARAVVDQDDQAEALVQRRIQAAQARSGALTRADHSKFDQAIRGAAQPIQVHRSRKKLPRRTGSIRDAFVWAEILGPPVARREP